MTRVLGTYETEAEAEAAAAEAGHCSFPYRMSETEAEAVAATPPAPPAPTDAAILAEAVAALAVALGARYTVAAEAVPEGRNDDGVAYATAEVSRPDTERRRGARLAGVTLYAGAVPAIVWDRVAIGATVADIRAAEALAAILAARYPGAIATGRYRAALAAR